MSQIRVRSSPTSLTGVQIHGPSRNHRGRNLTVLDAVNVVANISVRRVQSMN